MKEKQFHNKIIWFTFIFSLFVIWVHAYNAELYLGRTADGATVYRLEHLIGDSIGQIAVPGFFMISSYLFYRNFSWQKLGEKWNSRIRSILLPFILWNFIYYLGYVIGSRLPWMTNVVGKGIIPFTLPAAVDAVLHYTYNYVFWYLYQLILLILLAPLIYLLLKRKSTGIGFLLLLWVLLWEGFTIPQLNLDALIYYSSAGFLGLHGRRQVEAGGSRQRMLLGMAAMIISCVAWYTGLKLAFPGWFVVCRLLAVCGLWLFIPGERLPEPKAFMTCNFFLYATHFAQVRFINKALVDYLPDHLLVPLILYLLMPFITLAISYMAGRLLRQKVPRIWELLNGGR